MPCIEDTTACTSVRFMCKKRALKPVENKDRNGKKNKRNISVYTTKRELPVSKRPFFSLSSKVTLKRHARVVLLRKKSVKKIQIQIMSSTIKSQSTKLKNLYDSITSSLTPPQSYKQLEGSNTPSKQNKSKFIDTNQYLNVASEKIKQTNVAKAFRNFKSRMT